MYLNGLFFTYEYLFKLCGSYRFGTMVSGWVNLAIWVDKNRDLCEYPGTAREREPCSRAHLQAYSLPSEWERPCGCSPPGTVAWIMGARLHTPCKPDVMFDGPFESTQLGQAVLRRLTSPDLCVNALPKKIDVPGCAW